MFKSYKYRLYPNNTEEVLLNKHFGACRFIYNLALETKNLAYSSGKKLSCFDLCNQLPDLKKELIWLKEINAQSLQQSIINLDVAFTNFFKYNADFPKFKSKRNKHSFQVKQDTRIDFEKSKLFIPKFREGIKCIFDREFNGIIKGCTLSKNKIGHYFVSILVEDNKNIPSKNEITINNSVGIDVGLKYFCVTSDNQIIDNPKYLKNLLDRIKVLQKRLRNKKKGSKNQKKAYKYIAKLYNDVVNQRKDFLQKLSTKIVNENQGAIIVEDLNISGMMKRCKPKQDENGKYLPNGQSAKSGLNKSIQDVSWGKFINMLEYKCEWYGRTFHKIGRFEPSSKMCSCGYINKELTLADREWKCSHCNSINDRDLNAAKNIKKFGLLKLINTGLEQPVVPVEMSTLVGSVKQEISN